MVEIPLNDVLEILPSETFEYKQTGLVIDGDTNSNLCVRAFRLMQENYHLPNVYMHLRKIIPMGAGLGGGSSDAAYVIKGLNELFELNLSIAEMELLASKLGSDCAFFIRGGAQISEGRGEVLTPINLDLKGIFLKLNYPNLHIGTAEAYATVIFDQDCSGYIEMLEGNFEQLRNSFETYAFSKYPELESIKKKLIEEGAFYAAMSGSGSAVYGLFREEPLSSNTRNEWVLKL